MYERISVQGDTKTYLTIVKKNFYGLNLLMFVVINWSVFLCQVFTAKFNVCKWGQNVPEWSSSQTFFYIVGSWPYLQVLYYAGKACQGQTL